MTMSRRPFAIQFLQGQVRLSMHVIKHSSTWYKTMYMLYSMLRVAALHAGSAHLDRDMFSLMWGPTVAAVSVVLDHAEDMTTVRQALDGLLQAAKLGAYHHVDEV